MCEIGHYQLWQLGIEHSDPRLANLMVTRDKKNRLGVLNDWDLSFIRDSNEQHVGGERTGTVPFTAIELLSNEYWKGRIARRYRHDLEELIWVLPWIFLQYMGSELVGRKLRSWKTGDYDVCRRKKQVFLMDFSNSKGYLPTESWTTEWELARWLLGWILQEQSNRLKTQLRREPVLEASNEDVYKAFWRVVKDVGTSDASLSYLLRFDP